MGELINYRGHITSKEALNFATKVVNDMIEKMSPNAINVIMGGNSNDVAKDIKDIEGLIHWIKQRNPVSNEAFSDISNIRFAVNQEYVDIDHLVQAGDELAFFPPVPGG